MNNPYISGGGIGGWMGDSFSGLRSLFDWGGDESGYEAGKSAAGVGSGDGSLFENEEFLKEMAKYAPQTPGEQFGWSMAAKYAQPMQVPDMSQYSNLSGLMGMIGQANQLGGQQPYQEFMGPLGDPYFTSLMRW